MFEIKLNEYNPWYLINGFDVMIGIIVIPFVMNNELRIITISWAS